MSCPPVLGLGSLIVFFFLHLVEHHYISYFYEKLNSFGPFGFYFISPSFVWAPLIIENFFLCPLVLLRHFQSSRFFLCLSHLLIVWGVILAKVILKKKYYAKKRTTNDIF
jgi:hypothetical protein